MHCDKLAVHRQRTEPASKQSREDVFLTNQTDVFLTNQTKYRILSDIVLITKLTYLYVLAKTQRKRSNQDTRFTFAGLFSSRVSEEDVTARLHSSIEVSSRVKRGAFGGCILS